MYRSHRHHTRNGVAVLPTTLILYVFVQLFVFQTGLDLLMCTSRSERHHGVTNNLLTILLQPLQKVIYKTDRNQISVSSQNTVENAARRSSPVWTPRTDQCDRCRAVIQETFHVVTGSVKKTKYFICRLLHRSQREGNVEWRRASCGRWCLDQAGKVSQRRDHNTTLMVLLEPQTRDLFFFSVFFMFVLF